MLFGAIRHYDFADFADVFRHFRHMLRHAARWRCHAFFVIAMSAAI